MHLGPWRVLNVPPEASNSPQRDAASTSCFRDLFRRFGGDELNYWNEAKQSKMGKLGLVTEIYDDDTVTMVFEDLQRWDFPFEALEPTPPANVRGFRFVADDAAVGER